jgi:hypothetical protein
MRILDTEKGTVVEFETNLSEKEKEVLNECLLLYKLELKDQARRSEIEDLAKEMKKGRWERVKKTLNREFAGH